MEQSVEILELDHLISRASRPVLFGGSKTVVMMCEFGKTSPEDYESFTGFLSLLGASKNCCKTVVMRGPYLWIFNFALSATCFFISSAGDLTFLVEYSSSQS